MDLEKLKMLIEQYMPMMGQYVLMALGAGMVLGRIYIKMTPTQDDDHWLQALEEKPVIGQILSLLVYFSPVARKEAVVLPEGSKPVEPTK